MNEHTLNSSSGYLLALVATLLVFLIVPAASSASRRLKPAWRAGLWPLAFAGIALTGLCAALAATLDVKEPFSRLIDLLAGLSFSLLTLNALYRAIHTKLTPRLAPLIGVAYLIFAVFVLIFDSFVTVLIYDSACSVVVFLVYSGLYASYRDRAPDALPIMIGAGLILLADLVASFEFTASLGLLSFNQIFPFNLVLIIALAFLYLGASASYNVGYDLQRSRERALSSQ